MDTSTVILLIAGAWVLYTYGQDFFTRAVSVFKKRTASERNTITVLLELRDRFEPASPMYEQLTKTITLYLKQVEVEDE